VKRCLLKVNFAGERDHKACFSCLYNWFVLLIFGVGSSKAGARI
jgi:hypothetical protein